MPDWITVIIVLLIVGIVLDGIRRVRIHRRENIRLTRRAKLADAEVDAVATTSNSEFPSGGARVAVYRKPDEAENINKNVRQSFTSKRTTVGAPSRIPEQVKLNLDETVPMLMDSVEVEGKDEADVDIDNDFAFEQASADDLGVLAYAPGEEYHDDHDAVAVTEEYSYQETEPSLGSLDDIDDALDEAPAPHKAPSYTEPAEQVNAAPKKAEPEKAPVEKREKNSQPVEKEEKVIEPEEVLIINVMAKKGERFLGEALLQALMDQHIKFGDMDIFHRHADENGDGPILFSVANMVVPGTFNLASMSEFTTPGVSLFLSLPVEAESLVAFNTMADAARGLADALGGELKDENRSVMTKQTIEHARQKVMEFERKRKLRAR